jgi:hypothetical protein
MALSSGADIATVDGMNNASLEATAGLDPTNRDPAVSIAATGNSATDTATTDATYNSSAITSPLASEVFAVPELLENILLHLPMLDLLTVAQRVNKTFLDTITSSVHLRRALFFETRPQTQVEKDGYAAPNLNPLLRRMFPDNMEWEMFDCSGKSDCNRDAVLKELCQIAVLPFGIPVKSLPLVFDGHLCKAISPDPYYGEVDVALLPDEAFFMHLPNFRLRDVAVLKREMPFSETQVYGKASWRMMYPTDAPIEIHRCSRWYGRMIHDTELEWNDMGHIMRHIYPRA